MTPLTPPAAVSGWLRRFGFRLALTYMVVFALPALPGLMPALGWLGKWYRQFCQAIVPWVGREVMHLDKAVVFRPTGSGDTLFSWVLAWCGLVLAFVGALIWSWFDRTRRREAWVHEGVRIAVRYTLGASLLFYGVSKMLHLQMPAPNGDALLQAYGDSSPMRLAWTFMGYSKAYSLFAGLAEVVGGLLLFFRRTTLAGALLTAGVMLNVVMMNLCFDIPVKLYSTQLFLSAVFLTVPAWPRLGATLFSNQPAPPVPIVPWTAPRGVRIAARVVKLLLVGWILYSRGVAPFWQGMSQRETAAAKSPFAGQLYEVRGFTKAGVEQPLLVTEAKLWRSVFFNAYNVMVVRQMDRSPRYYPMEVAEGETERFTLVTSYAKEAKPEAFTARRPAPGELVLEGTIEGVAVTVRLRRIDEKEFLLVKRGFHWVNEVPFNR